MAESSLRALCDFEWMGRRFDGLGAVQAFYSIRIVEN